MIILGIDPGTRYAGYAVLKKEKQQTSLIESGCLDISKKKSLIKKIGALYEFISTKVVERKVTHLSIETPFLYKNAATFLKLGYVRGIVYLIADQYDLELYEFAPREIKRAVTGYGNASKEQVAFIVMKLFKIQKPQRDDTTDAVAIALCGSWKKDR